MQRTLRTDEPNGVARTFWAEIRAGVMPDPDPDAGIRVARRRSRTREAKLRRHVSKRRR